MAALSGRYVQVTNRQLASACVKAQHFPLLLLLRRRLRALPFVKASPACCNRCLLRVQEAAVARHSAEEVRAQLSTETERARSVVRAEQDQAALMQKLEQFNLLRESNAQLRSAGPKQQQH